MGSGLVAAVLPTPVQTVAAMPSTISTTSSSQQKTSASSSSTKTATAISQILLDSRENKKTLFSNNNSDVPAQVTINRVVAPVSNENALIFNISSTKQCSQKIAKKSLNSCEKMCSLEKNDNGTKFQQIL